MSLSKLLFALVVQQNFKDVRLDQVTLMQVLNRLVDGLALDVFAVVVSCAVGDEDQWSLEAVGPVEHTVYGFMDCAISSRNRNR